MKATPEQISQLKKRASAINYSRVSVDKQGKLEDRKSLLDKRIVSGYGLIWGSINDYKERFVKGCASRSITDNGPGSNSTYQIKLRDRHGKVCALMAKMQEDDIGLYFETEPLDEVQWCDDLLVQIRSGSINNFSIGFKYLWDRIEYDETDDCLVMLEIRLFEISAVDIPSDIATFAIRSAEESETLIDETEQLIKKLPKELQLETRKIFARYKTPVESAPGQSSPAIDTPLEERHIDYSYLSQNLNF